jgi:hypothetical protein
MADRTTLMLDDETRIAARRLAKRYGCTVSDAIRRSVLGQRDRVFGVPEQVRAERKRVLRRLFELFEGNDAEDEVRRLKTQDEG